MCLQIVKETSWANQYRYIRTYGKYLCAWKPMREALTVSLLHTSSFTISHKAFFRATIPHLVTVPTLRERQTTSDTTNERKWKIIYDLPMLIHNSITTYQWSSLQHYLTKCLFTLKNPANENKYQTSKQIRHFWNSNAARSAARGTNKTLSCENGNVICWRLLLLNHWRKHEHCTCYFTFYS